MSARYAFALGIDPGPVTGIAVLDLDTFELHRRAEVFQCGSRSAAWLLGALLARICGNNPAAMNARARIEPFVRGGGPGARMAAGRVTADQVQELAGVTGAWGVPAEMSNAGTVKPWAEGNDCRRLRESGLLDLVPGMPHAKSALGQALYCAVLDCGFPDPLSRKTTAR